MPVLVPGPITTGWNPNRRRTSSRNPARRRGTPEQIVTPRDVLVEVEAHVCSTATGSRRPARPRCDEGPSTAASAPPSRPRLPIPAPSRGRRHPRRSGVCRRLWRAARRQDRSDHPSAVWGRAAMAGIWPRRGPGCARRRRAARSAGDAADVVYEAGSAEANRHQQTHIARQRRFWPESAGRHRRGIVEPGGGARWRSPPPWRPPRRRGRSHRTPPDPLRCPGRVSAQAPGGAPPRSDRRCGSTWPSRRLSDCGAAHDPHRQVISAVMRLITASCWKSFSPKYAAHSPTIEKSLATTVAHTVEVPGPGRPAQNLRQRSHADGGDHRTRYISAGSGANTMPAPAAPHILRSRRRSRG